MYMYAQLSHLKYTYRYLYTYTKLHLFSIYSYTCACILHHISSAVKSIVHVLYAARRYGITEISEDFLVLLSHGVQVCVCSVQCTPALPPLPSSFWRISYPARHSWSCCPVLRLNMALELSDCWWTSLSQTSLANFLFSLPLCCVLWYTCIYMIVYYICMCRRDWGIY